MDELSTIFPDNLPNPDYQAYYREVLRQINKDFHPYSMIPEPEGLLSADWIFDHLQKMVEEIVMHQQQVLGAIIYRVDLPEKQVRKSMSGKNSQEKPEELTRQILRREAQKVWIRNQYK